MRTYKYLLDTRRSHTDNVSELNTKIHLILVVLIL